MDELKDEFPTGMSVLAVDDDRICLKILETLLQKCQYHVTTATNAIMALNLLRKNKKKFDLVISDVHMPDMDGFKLLELIGLEMDLPVIMLSANDDPKMVMKGISHGACDYLLKPVRIEELKNIWQHVIRKKKITTKIRNQQDTPNSDSCNGLNSAVTANENQNKKSSKKRKEQHSDDNDDDDDGDIDEHENDRDNEEDLITHKKPRVVWSVELHRKFLAAVNQLGVDRAVPKKILDLMNVEHLTRENVASHLQKYRLYLKRNSCAENQQANNMVPALGNTNQSYLRMRSISEIGNLQTLNGSRQFHNNNAFNVNVHGLPSSGTLQLLQQQNLSNSTNDQLKFQSTVIRANPNAVQGMPVSISPMQNFSNKLSDYRSKVPMGCTASPFLDIPNNALILEPKVVGAYKNLGSQSYQSHHSQFSPSLLDNNGMCNDIWSSTMKSPMMNSLTNINSQGVSNNVSLQGWINHNQDVNGGSIVSSSISTNAGEGGLNFSFGEPLGMNQLKSQNSGISSSFGSLEDILISKQKSDNRKLLDGYVFDNYSGGKSM